MKYLLAIILFISLSLPALQAQNLPINEQAARAELQRRGFTEAEVRAKLLQRGIDIDNVKPEQLPQLQPVLEEVLKELEQEKAAKALQEAQQKSGQQQQEAVKNATEAVQQKAEEAVKQTAQEEAAKVSEGVQEAVKEGATVQEAVTETLVEKTQEELPPSGIYGHEIFRSQGLELYRTTKDVKPPDSYVLGVGDEIAISIFGISQADLAFEINADGYITPAGLPRMYLKGITYGQAKTLVRNRFSQYYVFNAGEFALSLKSARTITVNIFGEVEKYGSFTISAINTAFNALVAAGGPTDIGTLRNITIIRNGKNKKMDVYKFLSNPVVQYDFFLENNDIIYVAPAERIVSISGAVKRPMRYELIQGENLVKLIEYAGGLTDRAYTKNIQVKRIQGDGQVLTDVNLADLLAGKKDFTLLPSDQVSIRNIPGRYENFATIDGAVELPGNYEITDSMRVSGLLAKGNLKPEARTDVAFLLRTNLDQTVKLQKLNLDSILAYPGSEQDLLLRPKDRVITYTLARFIDRATVSITGNVRAPVEQAFDPEGNIRVQDMILLAGGLEPTAAEYGYIKRTDPTNRKIKNYIRVNVYEALNNPADTTQNLALQPFDQLVIYNKEVYTDAAKVQISGAVRSPASFDYDPGMRVSDLVYMSGGLEQNAAQYGYIKSVDPANATSIAYTRVDLYKAASEPEAPENLSLNPGDALTVFTKERYLDAFSVSIGGAVRAPGQYDYDESLTVSDVIYLSGGLTRTAAQYGYIQRTDLNNPQKKDYIRVDLFTAVAYPDSSANLTMAPGDALQTYDQTRFTDASDIAVGGSVRDPGTFPYDPDMRISDIIYLAGGLTRDATDFGFITRTDFNNPKLREYQRVNVREAFENPGSGSDIFLLPFDRLNIMSVTTFTDVFEVQVQGAVRNPGTYQFDNTLTIKDVLTMAGGLKFEAASNRIDIFRVEIQQNKPTQTVVAAIEVDENYNLKGPAVNLQPYDLIVVRTVPDFDLQQTVQVIGEVDYPGLYALTAKNERLRSLIKRTGGTTKEAFPEGATLYRVEDGTGFVVTRLDKVLRWWGKGSRFNYILKKGDIITIPKNKDLVRVNISATLAGELYPDKLIAGGKINIAYSRGKRAKWYVDKYAGGIAKNRRARTQFITVEHPNGEIKRTKSFLFFHATPEVRKGSIVNVGIKPVKVPKPKVPKPEREKGKPLDWNQIVSNALALTASVVTILALSKNL